MHRPNSHQQKQISVPISNYTCSNQLVDAETVVRSTASIHNTYVDQTIAGKPGSVFRSTGVPAGTVLSTHKHLLVQLVRWKVSITAVCRRLIVKAWLLSRKKKYTIGNSGQLRSLLSRSTALVSAGGSKGAICIAVFSLNHKSLLLFRMCSFVAHFFAACFVTVCYAVLVVESVCTYYSLVCQKVVGLTATGWRQATATGLAAKFSNPCR